MTPILIPYYSDSGHTLKIAEEVAKGVEKAQVESALLKVDPLSEVNWSELHGADAIIFGSPTYMGSLPGQFKLFMDQTSEFWLDQKWANKIAAGFTIGASTSGDKLNSLVQLSVFAAQHSMIWVGQNHVGSKHTEDKKQINDVGSWLGLSATSNPDKSKMIYDYDALTANMFGERVANITKKWIGL